MGIHKIVERTKIKKPNKNAGATYKLGEQKPFYERVGMFNPGYKKRKSSSSSDCGGCG